VRAGINMTHIPYNSGPMAVQAVLSGLVQLSCTALPLVQPQINAGTLKALAVTGPQRWRGLPDVPTMAEAGFPDFVLDTMVMLEAPTHADATIVDKLSRAIQQVLQEPAVRQTLENDGFDVVARSHTLLAERIHKEVTLWDDVVSTTGMREP
jgi:tripartite-type tricarboxylate transporter receptor subunit TctC